MTPNPQPNVMTIQPEFSAFDLASRMAATTPSPRMISSAVPMISAGMMSTTLLSPPPGGASGTAGTSATLVLRTAVRQRPLCGRRTGCIVDRRLLREEGLQLRHDDLTVRIRVDRATEAHLDRMTAQTECPGAARPGPSGRHRGPRAGDVHGHDRDAVLLREHRGARAQLAHLAAARARALRVQEQVPALVDQAVDVVRGALHEAPTAA